MVAGRPGPHPQATEPEQGQRAAEPDERADDGDEAAWGHSDGAAWPLGSPRWLTAALYAALALALVVAGGALAIVTGLGAPRQPADGSVDVGFARDMSTHHEQAVRMAQIVRDRGTDPAVRLLAYDIETQQLGQVGQMHGWLDTWGLTPQSNAEPMAWMGGMPAGMAGMAGIGTDGRLMPGMASTTELTKLASLSGRPLDIYFMQLMIRHHEGGLPMAQYAVAHASESYVRTLAQKIVTAQAAEVTTMEQLLAARGATPLPS